MRKIRVGVIGLGDIAQKVYLPLLSKEEGWLLAGAYTPNPVKRQQICASYRMNNFASVQDLCDQTDAVFVHSATSSHYEIVSTLLSKGKDVYVDKPLAATVEEAEKLIELSHKNNRKLMVGFNRRFAPLYVTAKQSVQDIAWVRMEKFRNNGVRPISYQDTLLDEYIHLVDTVRWLSNGSLCISDGAVRINDQGSLLSSSHVYRTESKARWFTGFHCHAGSGVEQLEIVGKDKVVRVKDLNTMEIEENGELRLKTSGSWDTILKEKGFEDAVRHFLSAIEGDTAPVVDGVEALKTQQLLMKCMNESFS